jgi:hypothetical protein
MVVTGGRQREYGDLSYHHIVLGLGEVDDLHIVTRQRSLAQVGSPPPSFCRSLHWTLSAHDARRHALPPPQSLPCVSARVWPTFCVSLGEMPFDVTFLAMRTSNGVRPGMVSKFLCHILSIMLITFQSKPIRRPTLKHSSHHYSNLSL